MVHNLLKCCDPGNHEHFSIEVRSAATRSHVDGAVAVSNRFSRFHTEGSLITMFVAVQNELDPVSFKNRNDEIPHIAFRSITIISSASIGWMMKVHNSPELARRTEIPLKPVQHVTSAQFGSVQCSTST